MRPFPQVDSGRWQISTTGGTRPAWARSGRELFYLDASNTLTAVPVQTSGSTFSAGKPAKVFDAKYSTPFPPRSYDVSAGRQAVPDAQRQRSRRSERNAGQHGRRRALVRGAETACEWKVKRPKARAAPPTTAQCSSSKPFIRGFIGARRSALAKTRSGSNSQTSGPPSFAHECRQRMPRRSVATVAP